MARSFENDLLGVIMGGDQTTLVETSNRPMQKSQPAPRIPTSEELDRIALDKTNEETVMFFEWNKANNLSVEMTKEELAERLAYWLENS